MFSRLIFLINFECSNVSLMATINYKLQSKSESAPIYLLLSAGRRKIIFRKIGKSINSNNWSSKTGLPKQTIPSNKNLTTKLRKLKTFILDNLDDPKNKSKDELGDWLSYNIDLFFNRITDSEQSELVTDNIQIIIDTAHTRDNAKKGIGLSLCRINSYKRLKALFNEFQDFKKHKVKELDKTKFDEFKTWLLDDKNYSPTYSLKKISDLKTVCKDARSRGVETSPQLNDIKVKQVSAYDDDMDVIILTPSEIEKIEKAELPTKALINARKWLILACFTGQRGEDLTTRIKTDNFEQYGENLIIKITQQKGNKSVIIPVLPKVKEIYENGMPYIVSTQKLNKHFKQIGKIAKIDTMIMGRIIEASPNKSEKRKRGIKKLRPKYEYISTHIGRRSFASNHYGKIPTPIIMRVTNHSKESTFLTYINQTDNSHIDTFLDYYKAKEKTEKKANLKVIKKAN